MRSSRLDVETDPVVAYRQQQTAILEREGHRRNARLGMTGDVAQCLLRDTEEA